MKTISSGGKTMQHKIIYRHWQPGDDDAILELLVPSGQLSSENSYRNKFRDWSIEAEGICLAFVGGKAVGHILGMSDSFLIEQKIQKFGRVGLVHVNPNMRRRGIATHLMHQLHAYFEKKGYRGSILDTDEEAAIRLYQKVGYQILTRELRTQLAPNPNASQLTWTETNLKNLSALPQLDERWAKRNFPMSCDRKSIKVNQYNMGGYRVLRQCQNIVGYARWDEPSEYYRHGLIRDPIAPDVDPMEVIASVQAAIPTTRTWEAAEGGRYEAPLRAYGCTFEPTTTVIMLSSFGQEIDLTGYHRTAWW
ncbi:GNAT family N-acetyltransferase [Candidatus Poribacteria bacterium]|nr:GNAT family N-acetyltransferase [Candidatus Poribacteria bacterium]MYK21044.1 GNAT family N-acetyltransferase [Candidatus Poribacteria bacterium]